MGASGNLCYDLYFLQCTQAAEIGLIKNINMVVKLCWQQYLLPLSGEVILSFCMTLMSSITSVLDILSMMTLILGGGKVQCRRKLVCCFMSKLYPVNHTIRRINCATDNA